MSTEVVERLRTILEENRDRMRLGGHPKDLPDQILALVKQFPTDQPVPDDLKELHAAASHYWSVFDQPDQEPDPIDFEMVCDELIDALYKFYELR
jgi:hypothetical protein